MKHCSNFSIAPVAYVVATILLCTEVTPTEAGIQYDAQYQQTVNNNFGVVGSGDNFGTTSQSIENHYSTGSSFDGYIGSIDSFAVAGRGSLGASSSVTFTVINSPLTSTPPSSFNGTASASFGFDDVIFSGPLGGTIPVTLLMQLNGTISANGQKSDVANAVAVAGISGDILTTSTGSILGRFNGGYEIRNESGNITITQGGILSNYNLQNPTAISSTTLNVPTNIPLELDLTLTATVSISGYGPDVTDAVSNYRHTLSLPTSGPVFDLPQGYTVNSVEGDIVNNSFVGGATEPIPEPSTLVMSSILIGIFGVVWSFKRLNRITAEI
jgi:hypothetical protein